RGLAHRRGGRPARHLRCAAPATRRQGVVSRLDRTRTPRARSGLPPLLRPEPLRPCALSPTARVAHGTAPWALWPRIGRGRGPTGGPARGTRRGERARVRDGRRPDAVLRRHAASQRAQATCRSPIASAETTRRRTMEYRRFGNTGMYVSPIALGC